MAFASGSGVRVAYVPELVFGTTPVTPAFKPLRVTSGGLRTNKSTGTSNERRPDRNVADEFELGQDVTGTLDFEMTYGSMDDMIADILFSEWDNDVIKNGVTPKFFTLEETIPVGAVEYYSRFSGCMANTMSLNIAAREEVKGQIGFMGTMETPSDAALVDATYTDPSTTPIMTASANVANFAVTGLTNMPPVRSLTLELNNNLRARPSVGTKYSAEFGAGRFDLTGTLNAYFANNALYERVLAHGGGAISFVMGNAAGEKYRVTLPKIIFGDGERAIGGSNDDVMINLPFRAVFDPTEACTLKIERAVA